RRAQMVDTQLRRRGIDDPRVLDAMSRVPRHRFVRHRDTEFAYGDYPVDIGLGQTISQPYIVAFMTQALALPPTARVLEIGTGSAYQTAILAEVAALVFSIEIVPEHAAGATLVLDQLHYTNVHVRSGDGYGGWPEAAPFDAVIVTAAPDHVPQPLVDQLKVGGRLVVPVGRGDQDLLVLTRTNDGFKEEQRLPVRFVPLTRGQRV
nr:protein-L-isoaspartate(D-aspartate) O-methyltransferase [Acidobacteriota bacterium]